MATRNGRIDFPIINPLGHQSIPQPDNDMHDINFVPLTAALFLKYLYIDLKPEAKFLCLAKYDLWTLLFRLYDYCAIKTSINFPTINIYKEKKIKKQVKSMLVTVIFVII